MKTCAQCRVNYPDALEFCPQDGSPLPGGRGTQALYDPYLGSTIDGRYLIEAKLGEGGMGVVYAARHVIIDKRVAMKVLKKEAQEEETSSQRFIQEAKSASKIGHANIVDITDFGVLPDGSAYFVMEFLEGQTLGQVIHLGPMSSRRVIAVAAQIARGLNAAHSKGIIHRDLKPENIFLLERDGHSDLVKIVDFGIAKVQSGGNFGPAEQRLTQVGMVLGTPEYMAPEQATGKESDHRVDEYALGCIMYEMLTGDVPFKGDSAVGTLTKHVFENVVPPSAKRPDLTIAPALEQVCLKAMAKQPELRYAGMKDLLLALDAAGAEQSGRSEPVRARQEATAGRDRPTQKSPLVGELDRVPRGRLGLLGAAAAVVLLLGIGGWVAFGRHVDPPPAAISAPPPIKPLPAPPAESKTTVVKLTLRTNPTGAEVFVGPELIGVAPLDYSPPFGAAPVTFTFKLNGYQNGVRELIPDRDRDVEIPLLPRKEARPRRARSPGGGGPAQPTAKAVETNPPPTNSQGNQQSKSKTSGELRDPF